MTTVNQTHFAKLDDNNNVIDIILITQDLVDTGQWGDPSKFVKSFEIIDGVEYIPFKNKAGIGYTFDVINQGFVPQKIFPSSIFNPETCQWEPPIPKPIEFPDSYDWDEQSQSWVQFI